MTKYKLITTNPVSGRTEPVLHFEAVNDGDAVQLAAEWRANDAAELWRTYRVVMRWERSKTNSDRREASPEWSRS
jgi:hypothetical protein